MSLLVNLWLNVLRQWEKDNQVSIKIKPVQVGNVIINSLSEIRISVTIDSLASAQMGDREVSSKNYSWEALHMKKKYN